MDILQRFHDELHLWTNCCRIGRDGWRSANCSAMHESPLTAPTPLVLSFYLSVFLSVFLSVLLSFSLFLVAAEPNEIITWHNFYHQLAHFQHGWVKWKKKKILPTLASEPHSAHWTGSQPRKGRSRKEVAFECKRHISECCMIRNELRLCCEISGFLASEPCLWLCRDESRGRSQQCESLFRQSSDVCVLRNYLMRSLMPFVWVTQSQREKREKGGSVRVPTR